MTIRASLSRIILLKFRSLAIRMPRIKAFWLQSLMGLKLGQQQQRQLNYLWKLNQSWFWWILWGAKSVQILAGLRLSVDIGIVCSTEVGWRRSWCRYFIFAPQQTCKDSPLPPSWIQWFIRSGRFSYVLGYSHGEIGSKMGSLSNMALDKERLDRFSLAMAEETKSVGWWFNEFQHHRAGSSTRKCELLVEVVCIFRISTKENQDFYLKLMLFYWAAIGKTLS